MQSESDGYIRQAMERLLMQVEEIKRRQEGLEGMMQRVMAEVELCRRQQDALNVEWRNFGARWSACLVTWEAQMQYLEGFTRQLEVSARQLEGFTVRLTALLPSEE